MPLEAETEAKPEMEQAQLEQFELCEYTFYTSFLVKKTLNILSIYSFILSLRISENF